MFLLWFIDSFFGPSRSLVDDLGRLSLLLFSIFGLFLFCPEMLFANDQDDIVFSRTLCNVVDIVSGPSGKTVTTLGIGTCAGATVFGKMAPATALTVSCGCAAMLGAEDISTFIVGGDEDFTCSDLGDR